MIPNNLLIFNWLVNLHRYHQLLYKIALIVLLKKGLDKQNFNKMFIYLFFHLNTFTGKSEILKE